MGSTFGRCLLLAALAISGCAPTAPAPPVQPSRTLPSGVDGGLGSQHGNYAARTTGAIPGPDGEQCILFQWDRPVSGTHAVRYVSASCPSKERPGRMVARQISRSIVPLSESHLAR